MKLLAFSDWRVQNIEKLIEYLQRMNKKPDFIIYAGDDIDRFNKVPEESIPKLLREHYINYSPLKNYFEEIARFSKYGLLVVCGNDDFPFVKLAISGKNVYNMHKETIVTENHVFIGLEGSTTPPGILLYSEEQVWEHLNQMVNKIPLNKDVIVISHTPPYGLLDIGIRFGIEHIGSKSLRKFIDKYNERVKIVICGHAHSQGGKATRYKNTWIINCASHDAEGEPGKIAIINIHKNIEIEWDFIYECDCKRK